MTTSRIGRVGALLATLVILAVTLAPGGGREVSPLWCLLCGYRATADALRNILLFLPLGVLLRLGGWPARRVILSAALLSFSVELAQFIVPGRDPGLRDLATNTLGAALGAWLAGAPVAAWLLPAPARAWRLAAAWCVAVVLALAAGRSLMVLSLPDTRLSPYYGQWMPQRAQMAWYGGSVRQATLGGRMLPDALLDASDQLRASLLAGDTLAVDVLAGPRTRDLAPIFSIADDRGREIVLVGAEGEDLVLRFRTRAAWLRLEQPSVRMPGAFRQVRVGQPLALRVWHLGPDACLELDGRQVCPGSQALRGWAYLVPESWLGAGSRRVFSVLWAAGLLLPACYWLALALGGGRASGGTGR